MASKNAWNILVGVELDVSDIQKQIDQAGKNIKDITIKADTESARKNLDKLDRSATNAAGSADNLKLSYQAANAVFRETVDVLGAMLTQVFELDTALTEFKKVSDLSSDSLDNYVSSLSEMGLTVGRTGKPKCLSLGVGMINLRHTTVQNPVSPKAYLTTMAA